LEVRGGDRLGIEKSSLWDATTPVKRPPKFKRVRGVGERPAKKDCREGQKILMVKGDHAGGNRASR